MEINKKRFAVFLATIVLITAILTAATVIAVLPTNLMTFSTGPYPGASDYTIFRDSGTYYSKDKYGAISSDSNATVIIQAALTALSYGAGGRGGQIEFLPAEYIIDPLTVYNNTRLIAMGDSVGNLYNRSVVFSMRPGVSGVMFTIEAGPAGNAAANVVFDSLIINGNDVATTGISSIRNDAVTIRNCHISKMTQYGIYANQPGEP